MTFEFANRLPKQHLIVQPSDLRYNPPESYLFVQDGLIISCGVLYALCYMFYATRTYRDKTCAGAVEYLCGTMAYEIYYAFVMTSTTFERLSFLVWFLMDVSFAAVAVYSAYPLERRKTVVRRLVIGATAGIAVLYCLGRCFPDEREQVTAYWTGLLLQVPISWGSLILLWTRQDTKGQSLEIWYGPCVQTGDRSLTLRRITRYLGCYTAYGVFIWRYMNIPSNWSYVANFWSITIMVITLIPETLYPFVYVWTYRHEKKRKSA